MNQFNLGISIVNLIVLTSFWYRFAYPVADSTAGFFANSDSISSLLAAQANHHSLLQLYLVALSIVLAFGAIWGYSQIKNEVIRLALEKINETGPAQVQKMLKDLGPEAISEMLLKNKLQTPSNSNSSNIYEEVIPILGDPDERRFP